jgi:hypothetical protein
MVIRFFGATAQGSAHPMPPASDLIGRTEAEGVRQEMANVSAHTSVPRTDRHSILSSCDVAAARRLYF